MDDKQLDQLTRKLMEGVIEKPSVSLVGNVMERIVQEKQNRKQHARISWLPVASWIVVGLLAYFLLSFGLGYILFFHSGGTTEVTGIIMNLFPLISVGLVVISVFFFFVQLDGWLRWKKYYN